jgi:predicted transcriptional regulator
MTSLSLVLPEALAQASQSAARKLRVSRTQFIRQAIVHELENLRKRDEQLAMVKSIKAMKASPEYLAESEEIEEGFKFSLPDEEDNWWSK